MKYWYAVQRNNTDSWDFGSYDFEEAKQMLIDQGEGLIAVIAETNTDAYCECEIRIEVIEI